MMRLLVIVFYIILGVILWKVVRGALRMMQGAHKERNGRVHSSQADQAVRTKESQHREIQEADFEDLTPPRKEPQGSKNTDT